MTRHARANVLLAALVSVAAFGAACDDGDDAGKVALSALLPEPVPVDLGLTTGTMTFDLSAHPLDMERISDLTSFFVMDGIGVTVTNVETQVSHDLTEGFLVSSEPSMQGEYSVSVSADGAFVTVTFYNWLNGHHVDAGTDYVATVTVLENEFFVTETFNRQVAVDE